MSLIKTSRSEEQSLKQKTFDAPVKTEAAPRPISHNTKPSTSNSYQQGYNNTSTPSTANYGQNYNKPTNSGTQNNYKTIIIVSVVVIAIVAAVAYFSTNNNYDDWESSERSDWVLPESENNVYYEEDFEEMGLTLDDVQLAINEIYAYYGYEFDGSLYEHFCSYDWYDPDTTDPYTIESRFSDTDRETFLNLCEYRKKLKNQ